MSEVQAPRFEATLTDKYQNTVPAAVRKVLHLGRRDRIAYVIRDGKVILEKVESQDDHVDPTIQAFLGFLQREMINNPQRLKPFGGELNRRAAELVEGMDVDLDVSLDDQ